MAEPQIEVRTEYPYVNIRKSIFRDTRINSQTKYVLILMLSLPPDWDYSIRGLAQIAHVSKDTMSKMVQKLENAGYLIRKPQPHTDKGRFGKTCYILTDVPIIGKEQDEPCPNLPDTVSPDTENSPQLNNKQLNNKQQNTPYSPPEGDARAEEAKPKKSEPKYKPDTFEYFWRKYPRKDNRQMAIRAWDKLKPDKNLCYVMLAALERDKQSLQWTKDSGQFIPLFSTWLNQGRWENKGVDLSLLPQARDAGGFWADAPGVNS